MKRKLKSWQLVLIILILVSLACNVTFPAVTSLLPAATPSATPVPLPPTIIETIPPVGSVIPQESLLTVFFSEKMDRASVEQALNGDFPGGFVFGWVDDSTLTLAPKKPMPVDSKVTFSLASSARSMGGLYLPQPVYFSYQTPGLLSIAQILPADGAADVSPDSAVVVTFNQPVVPLGSYSTTLPAGITLEPAVPGKGEWLNTSTYIFHGDSGLAGGIRYTARINPGLISTSKARLDSNSQGMSWSFTTVLPAVSDVTPHADKGRINLDTVFEINFNQPMDSNSVENSFALTSTQGKVSGTFEWNQKYSLLKYKTADLLSRGADFTLKIGAESRSKGGAPLGSDWQTTFQTVPLFSVLSTNLVPGHAKRPGESESINFSAPLAKYSDSELGKLITITPKVSSLNLYVDESVVNVSGSFLPGQAYILTFSADLKDRWGQPLSQDYSFNFREPDAVPSLVIGTYVPVLFTSPDDPRISVQAVNLNSLNVTFGKMPISDFLQVQADYKFRDSYLPQDQKYWSIYPRLPLNENKPMAINLSDAPLVPGFYQVTVDSPDVQPQSGIRRTLVVSNLNVTIKVSPTEVLIWAVDLVSQGPAKDIPFKVYDEKSREIASGLTDQNGLWRGPLQKLGPKELYSSGGIFTILGQPGEEHFGAAASNWNYGLSPWGYGLYFDDSPARPEVYMYSERPIYRPGDTVYYRGILKDWYDGRYRQAEFKEVNISLSGSNGKISQPQPIPLSAYGSFSGEFKLATNSAPGDYNITVTNQEKDLYGGNLYFKVAEYRKPEINLSVAIAPDPAKSGQQLIGTLKAEYFFGSPAADLPFTWSLYSNESYFSIPEYETGIPTFRWLSASGIGLFGSFIKSGEGRTGVDGSFSIPLNDIRVENTSEITLEVSVSESGGFPVSARASAILHPENFYIGVRPNAWVGQAGSELGFDLKIVDWGKRPVSQPLSLAFQKVRWERTDGLFGDFSFTPIYTLVESKSITSSADGMARLSFTPQDPGTYVLDASSGQAHTQTLVWVTGGENAEWPNLPFQKIQLTPDKDKYKPGETAKVFIPNPFNAPVLALLTTERSTFKSIETVIIPAAGFSYGLAITDESAPNIYVSATILGPQGVDFRQGYINLPVDAASFRLNVDLKATPAKASPGQPVTLNLTVTDSKGQPVQAEFSMAMVDLALLALADPNSEDIFPAYYDIQPLGVITGLTAAIHSRRMANFGGGGGGGGGGELLALRSKFPDTAYWKADIMTDVQGKAQVTFTLPDNLTTWEVDTRGLTNDTRVGQARVRVVTSKELLIRSQTPRFLVVGDHAELAAMVNNTTAQALDATVILQAPGLTLDDPNMAEQKVSIPATGRVRVAWTGLVERGPSINATFAVKAGSLQDAASPNDGPIPVLRYSAPQTFSTAGILTGEATQQEIIAIPRSFQPLGGDLLVELSPSLAATILGSLKVLETTERPWNSEQIVSKILPNLAAYRALKESGIDDHDLKVRLQSSLVSDLRLLMTFRGDDGGWRWTVSSEKTDPYLTAYIIYGFQQANESGLNLDGVDLGEAMISMRNYLFANADPFTGKADLSVSWQVNRAAFYLYVLGKTGGLQDFNWLAEKLFEVRDKLDPWAKSMFALTLYSLSPLDPRVEFLLSDIEASAVRSATGAHWESATGDWGSPESPLFTTAVVVEALAERNPASTVASDAVRYLASQRDPNGRWSSSYETAWVLMALSKHMQVSGDLRGDFAFSTSLNGTALAQGQASGPENMTVVSATTPLTQLNLSGANSLLIKKQAGTGRLYYRAALTVDRPAETAPAVERGISIIRQYLDCSSSCQPTTSYQMKADKSGRVTVRLTVTLPNDAYYLMVDDYIPAGTEILDQSIKTNQQGQPDQKIQLKYDPADPFEAGWGWWYFNRPQIYDSHILWSADFLPAGMYELTYTIVPSLAGEYRVLPARAWQAYFPEVQGSTAGAVFEIKP